MKPHSYISLLPLLIASLLVTTGCPKKNPDQISLTRPASALADAPSSPTASESPGIPPPSPAPSPVAVTLDPFSEMTAALEAATANKHEGLSAVQQRMDRQIDDQIAARKATGHEVSLAEDERLDSATEDFAEKLRMLTLSSPEVWDSAKHNTKLSLLSVRSAYAAIMNKPEEK